MKIRLTPFGWLVGALIVGAISLAILPNLKTERITITIKKTERITTGSGEDIRHKYLVFTEGEVFENTDALFFGKFNSSDFQNKLDAGNTYEVRVSGYRVPFLSMYRNIVTIY